jgi:predicted permease
MAEQLQGFVLKIYRALARAFPDEARQVYGEELVQTTEDSIEWIWREQGLWGLMRLLLDIAIRVPAEHLAEFGRDVRYGLRMLAGSPGFTAVALISLSLGICIATSAFSEMNGLILRNVPGVERPDELVVADGPTSYPNYKRYRDVKGLFSASAAYVAPAAFGVSNGGRAERVWGHLVTSSYFSTLGVRPFFGRVFSEEDDQPGRAPNVVVSYRYWQEHLGAETSIIGKALRINGHPCTVIGVGPKGFLGASPMVYVADLWLPVAVGASVAPELAENALERHDRAIFHFVGRLEHGIGAARAEAAIDGVARQIEQENGDVDRNKKGRRVTLLPGGKTIPVRKQDLPVLMGYLIVLGGMVLLIACSNVANMMLARAAERRREIAIRLAMGAGRWRLIRQLLTESLLVAAGAGVLGFLLSVWVMNLNSQTSLPYPMPLQFDLRPDGTVLLFTIGLTIFTGLVFGLVPAWQTTRADLNPALKEGGNVQLSRLRRLSLRNALVLSEVAGSLALLLITGFLVLGHRRIAGVEVGFDPKDLYLVTLDPIRDGYSSAQAGAFFQKLLDRGKTLPSVRAIGLADSGPMTMIGKPAIQYAVEGKDGTRVLHSARRAVVGDSYFETVGIPILSGREFRKQDEANDAKAVIVSERLARECWKGQDALGQRIEIGSEEVPDFHIVGYKKEFVPGMPESAKKLEVVGVAKNVRDGLVLAAADSPAVIYTPWRPPDYAHPSPRGLTLMVRSVPGGDAVGALRREISAMDDKLTVFSTRSMPEQIEELMFPVRVALWTYGVIGIVGLILASVGLAGVTAYSVTQRRREIGIRMALGAQSSDVLRLVMREGMAMVMVGSVIGLGLAWSGTRALSAVLSTVATTAGTSSGDPRLLLGAPLLLAGLAMVACYVPARRSVRVDPVVTLRQE